MVVNVIVKFELFLTSIFRVFGLTKNMKLIDGGYFEFQLNLEITCTSSYRGECDCKILVISDLVFVPKKL